MEAKKYRIVTTGEIHAGFTLQEVKKNLLGLCKDDKDKLDRIFSGNLFVLVSDIDLIAARRHKTSLQQSGIVCQIEPLTPIVRDQEPTHQAQPALPTSSELSGCPKCGASYNGEAVCVSCGVVPAKYLERQRLEQEIKAVPVAENKDSKKAVRVAVLVIVGVILISTTYLLPKNFKYEISDWIDRIKAPNFDLPPNRFPELSQSDIIREYNDRGYTLYCNGNLRPEEQVSKRDDYACWMPIKSAYNNIPARMVTFFFSGGKLSQVRLEFPESSFNQVQEYLQKKMIDQQRLDSLPQYRNRTDLYGEPLLMWQIEGGVVRTTSKATSGRSFIVLLTKWPPN